MTTLVLSRRRSSRWSLLALVAAAATGLAVYSYLSWLRSQMPLAGPLAPMVVASRDIDSGTRIDRSMLEVVDHPSRYLPAGVFGELEQVVGRVAAVPVLKGDAVTDRKVGKTGGASSVVPSGMRAYSLNAQAVGGLAISPRAGDRVDILVTYAGEDGVAKTETILRSAKVATVGAARSPSSKGVGGALGVPSVGGERSGLTVLVTPEEAEHLAKAESLGKIAVVLAPNAIEPAPESEPEQSKPAG
jgi:pilus assembly protein CpaB